MDALSPEMAQLLSWAVRARKNIAVSGGTGGGKTTLLNALSRLIPHEERVITIEDSAELRFDQHPHVVRLEARLANAEGRGSVTIRELVTNALRMRPDRIVVGECRGAEALDMLQAMNTGHDGSLTTLHANSPSEVIPRLVMMVRYGMDLPTEIIEEQIASALDLVVQQDRLSGGKRHITQVAMYGENDAHGRRGFVPIVSWDRRTQRYEWGELPSWIEDLPYMNVATEAEVRQWVQSVRVFAWQPNRDLYLHLQDDALGHEHAAWREACACRQAALLENAKDRVSSAKLLAPVLGKAHERKRVEELQKGMPEVLRLLCIALESGSSLVMALRYAADNCDDPLAGELKRTVWDLEAGQGFDEALENPRARTGGSEFAYLAVAMEIQHQSGGSLTNILENVSSYSSNQPSSRRLRAKTATGASFKPHRRPRPFRVARHSLDLLAWLPRGVSELATRHMSFRACDAARGGRRAFSCDAHSPSTSRSTSRGGVDARFPAPPRLMHARLHMRLLLYDLPAHVDLLVRPRQPFGIEDILRDPTLSFLVFCGAGIVVSYAITPWLSSPALPWRTYSRVAPPPCLVMRRTTRVVQRLRRAARRNGRFIVAMGVRSGLFLRRGARPVLHQVR